MKNKELALVGILTALSVVVSSWLRVPLFANIKLDLSYIVLTIAIVRCSTFGACFVGGMGALLESLLFSNGGLSFSWVVANIIIALIGSFFFSKSKKENKQYLFIIGIILGCFVGLFLVKSILESTLFNIALWIRFTNNSIAALSDCVCMLIGVVISKRIIKK